MGNMIAGDLFEKLNVSQEACVRAGIAFDEARERDDAVAMRDIMLTEAFHGLTVLRATEWEKKWGADGVPPILMGIEIEANLAEFARLAANLRQHAKAVKELREVIANVQENYTKALKSAERREGDLLERITTLERRAEQADRLVDDLRRSIETAPFRYEGVHRSGQAYKRGAFVTHGGSLWHCDTDTTDRPPGNGWKLAVPRGRDGKDAR